VPAVALLLLALLTSASADPPERLELTPKADPLEGVYSVLGNEQGTEYAGAAVVRRQGDGYLVQMVASADTDPGPSPGPPMIGFALRQGDVLAIAWKVGPHVQVTALRIEAKNGALTGRWAVAGSDGAARQEAWRRLAPLPRSH